MTMVKVVRVAAVASILVATTAVTAGLGVLITKGCKSSSDDKGGAE